MNRFIGMVIIAVPHKVVRSVLEEVLKVRKDFLTAAHQLHHPIHVMRHEPALLVRVAFDAAEVVLQSSFLRPFPPGAVGVPGSEPTDLRIEHVLVGL